MADTMQTLRDGFKQSLKDQHDTWREIIAGQSAEALNWSPGPEMNSIAVLVTHSLGAEEFLLSAAVGQAMDRDRAAEFRAKAPDAAALARQIDELEQRTAALVDRLTPDDLSEVRQPVGDRLDRRHPGIWWLLHAVEHNREHIGQALMTRQLYEQRT